MNRIDLVDCKAIVTGGSGGLGQAIMARLQRSGAAVANFDRREGGALAAAELFCACDVTDEAAVDEAVGRAVGAFGRIDILVNNAGIAAEAKPVAQASVEAWRRVLDINLTGAFICCRAVVPHMVSAGYGRIVNLGSLRGSLAPALSGAYAASKAGLVALTRTLAKELAAAGVLVNCVAPTAIAGGMAGEDEDEAATAALVARIPLGRLGQPAEVAAMVAWLASADCSFSTGAVFDLSGGRAAP
jgi:NAD(P)-dependent dehydrogenase (short-subunit alcohol dehydrogenase family)